MARAGRADDLIDAASALTYFALMAAVFVARLADCGGWDRVFGAIGLLVVVPLAYLLIRGWRLRSVPICPGSASSSRSNWSSCFSTTSSRSTLAGRQAIVVPYVMLFFAALGALIGIAAQAGRDWMIAAIALFLLVAALTFVSRAVTGL